MPSWSTYLRVFIITAIAVVTGFYLFIVLVDPYDNVPFSLPFEREPISTNQRFSYPALARNPEFDSVIIGTSTARLLKPERLNRLTGDNWVNLAMNSATAYEQMEMLKLFLRHHPQAKNVVIGIDDAWCRPGEEIQKYTFRPFPPWMYDENQWNDLFYLFNDKALENAVRMVEYWSSKREAKYDRTGYRDFTEDFGEYNGIAVKSKLYPNQNIAEAIPYSEMAPINRKNSEAKRYASFGVLDQSLTNRSANTKVLFLFMPLHAAYLEKGAPNYRRCKGALINHLKADKNIVYADKMKIDELTTPDDNYWDPLHFRHQVARTLEVEITNAMLTKQ